MRSSRLRWLGGFALLILAAGAHAQGLAYRATAPPFALTDCRIETVARGVVERGTVVIGADGRIAAVGAGVEVPAGALVVPCDGGTVYPGLIDSGTRIGLQEIGAVATTVDLDEIGDVTPQMRALVSVNPSSVHIPVTRVAGVTTALTYPRGGLMPGAAALVNLHGYTPEQMATGFEAVVVTFPRSGRRGRFDRRETSAIDAAFARAQSRLDSVWTEAVLYARLDSARVATRATAPLPFQPELTALLPAVRGEQPLVVEVDAEADILKALDWIDGARARSGGRLRVILSGVAEGWRVADRIAAAGWPCLVGPVIALPTRDADRYERAFENPGLLAAAGVEVALRSDESENVRNLPFHAGFAAAYGAPHGFGRDAALAAVTLAPARIFGVADRLGSVEVGKEATLFVADGDPFEPRTRVTALFIGGDQIPLVSRQTDLYDEYLDRRPGLSAPGTRP